MRMSRVVFALAALALVACGGNARPGSTASYDLGSAAIVWQPAGLPVAGVEVVGPSWLATTAIQYRLLYADPLRRHAYAESRWAAPPAELVERALGRQPAAGAAACRVRLELDELIQVFDDSQQSRVLLELRASLKPLRGDGVLARKAFAVTQAAAGADAHGGVAAAATALQAAAGEMAAWLNAIARETPAIAARCRSGGYPD